MPDCVTLRCLLQAQQCSPLSPPQAFRGQRPMHPMCLPCSTSRSSKVWPGGATEVKPGSCTFYKCMSGFWCTPGQSVYRGGYARTSQVFRIPIYAVRVAVVWGCPAMDVFEKHILSSLSKLAFCGETASMTGCTCPVQKERRQQHPSSRRGVHQRLGGPDLARLLLLTRQR